MNAQQIPIDQIDPNPHQLRGRIETSDIKELVDSIKDVGVIQPLLITQKEDRYILVAGLRRLEASRQAELKEVPCVVQDLSDDDLIRYALIENLQRVDLSPLEEALALKQLIDTGGIDYRKAAELTGKSKTFVGERLALLQLPTDLKNAVSRGTISMKKADTLRKVSKTNVRAKLLERAPKLDLPTLKALVDNAEKKINRGRKPPKLWNMHQGLKEFSKSIEGVSLYKDRISFKFDTNESLRDLLTRVLKFLKEEVLYK